MQFKKVEKSFHMKTFKVKSSYSDEASKSFHDFTYQNVLEFIIIKLRQGFWQIEFHSIADYLSNFKLDSITIISFQNRSSILFSNFIWFPEMKNNPLEEIIKRRERQG